MNRLLGSVKVLVSGAALLVGAGLVVALSASSVSAQTGGGGGSDAPVCTGRASDPEGCKDLQPHGSPRTVLYVSTADQRRIEQLEAQLERLSDAFDARQDPSQADLDRYNREAARLVEQINAVHARSGDAFVRQAQACDVGPGQAGDAGRWYVCTPVDADGNLIDPPPTRYDRQDECQAAHGAPCTQISTTKSNADGSRSPSGETWVPPTASRDPFAGVGVSIQEYRLVSQRPEAPEGPTTPEPPLEAGQYTSEQACLHGSDTTRWNDRGRSVRAYSCREVRRGGRSHWENTAPTPRVRSDRVYPTLAECGLIHSGCSSVTRYHVDRAAKQVTEETLYVPSSTRQDYVTAEQCERYHRSCERVQTAPNREGATDRRTVYVPQITGQVYTDSQQCGTDHGGCDEYHRDTDGDGVHGETVYVPYGGTPYSTPRYSYDADGTLISETQTSPGTDIRAPGRIDPDPDPTQHDPVPYGAVDVDGTGSPTQYDTGTECIKAGGGLCGLGDDGKWYRLQY